MDLLMVAVVAISIFDGPIFGIIYGFIAGMLLDLIVGSITGINALVYVLNGFFAGKIIELGFRRKLTTYVLLIFFITEINLLITSGIYNLFNFYTSIREIGIEMIVNPALNILFMFIIFPLLSAGREKKEEFGFLYKDKI
jgi:rod shape-determining protein MreD